MNRTRIFFVGLMLALCLTLQAQMESHLTYCRYTIQDGLPQMQTERLWQDSQGYIYIGTLSGFVRFDGRTFTPFLKGRRENIVGFVETQQGVSALGFRRQWLIDADNVKMQSIDQLQHWQLNNLNAGGLPDGYVLLEDEQEQNRRLCLVTAQGFKPVLKGGLLDAMTPDRKLYTDSSCTIIPTPHGVYRVERGGHRAVRVTDRGDVYTLLRTDSALLAFTSDGIYKMAATPAAEPLGTVAAADWSSASFGLTVRRLRSGGLVIADEHTVYLYDGKGLGQVVTGINLIRDVLVDRWDRLWVATYQGVYCFFNRCFTNHRLTDENDIARAIGVDGDDRLIIGTLNGKLLAMGGDNPSGRTAGHSGTVVSDDPSEYYGTSTVRIGRRVFMPSRSGVTVVGDGYPSGGTVGHGVTVVDGRYRFLTQHGGRLITVSQQGAIASYDPETGRLDTLTTEIPYPWCAAFDAEGRLWAGGTMGVYCLSSGAAAQRTRGGVVTAMDADSSGVIFFASADSLFLIQKGTVRELNGELPQLAGHEIRSLHVSPRGFLIVAAIDGLFVCRIGKNYGLTDARFFDHRNGFTMLEPLLATIAETADGTVWVAGVEEMTSFHPADLLAYSEEDTFITPPLRWWQHWWVWLLALLAAVLVLWGVAYWYEKRRNRKKMIRLQREKLEQERRIETIRQKAIEAENTELAKDIVKMTERTGDERLTFRTASGVLVVDISDIAYFKGDGNYSQIVTFYATDTVLIGLGGLERMLDRSVFVRADRSTLVNIHNISSLLPKQRRCVFRSTSGQEVEARLLAPAFKRLQDFL